MVREGWLLREGRRERRDGAAGASWCGGRQCRSKHSRGVKDQVVEGKPGTAVSGGGQEYGVSLPKPTLHVVLEIPFRTGSHVS